MDVTFVTTTSNDDEARESGNQEAGIGDDIGKIVDPERALAPEATWMIGNSPRSDINPALEAGLHAVFIPHAHTWRLEQAEVPVQDGRLLVLQSFRQLRDHF